MRTAKILEVLALYRKRFELEGIPQERIVVSKKSPKTKHEMLSHAHFLLDGVEKYAQNPEKVGKTGRHLGSVQTILVMTGWYSLEEVMDHNRPD